MTSPDQKLKSAELEAKPEEIHESPRELRERLESLEIGNKKVFQQVLSGYEELVRTVAARLSDPATLPTDKKELVAEKKTYQLKLQEVQTKYPEYLAVDAKAEIKEKIAQLVERIPEEVYRKSFPGLIELVPDNLKRKYVKRLEDCLKNKDEVAIVTSSRGVFFELSRVAALLDQGLENVNFGFTIDKKVSYLGFPKGTADMEQTPSQKIEGPIDLDVPIVRGDKAYVYETKNYLRMKYGALPEQRNQVLKYQAAISQGLVDGATVELKGRVDPEFLRWAIGTGIADEGKIPDVEIVYNLELPSGSEYRFVLKRPKKNNGLQFHNEGRLNTPEATLIKMKEREPDRYAELISKFGTKESALLKLEDDRKVINGIQRAVLDRSIIDIISGVNIENPPAELLPHLSDPKTITSISLFDQYESLRKASIYEKLSAKREIVNVDNQRSAYSEYGSREYVERSLREYQTYLSQNPEMAKVKKSYVLKGEVEILAVIEKVMKEIDKVKDFELKRKVSEDLPGNNTRAERIKMGYSGPAEGVALDIEHLTIDAILEVNKRGEQKGRSYENPERFKNVAEVIEYLPSQDRRYMEIAIYDPMTGQTKRKIDLNEGQIKKENDELLRKNIKRAEAKMDENLSRLAELNQMADRTKEDEIELNELSSRERAVEMNRTRISRLKAEMDSVRAEKVNKVKEEKDNSRKKAIAAEFDEQILAKMDQLAATYKEVLGGAGEWDKIAERISERIDQNIIKFVYAVKSDGDVVIGEEVVRGGEASGRAAHSELAGGRNVYGAGELAFTKGADGKWSLTEINNGSGHYRPSATTLPYVKSLLQSKGLDTSNAKLRDALLRGVALNDLSLLEE